MRTGGGDSIMRTMRRGWGECRHVDGAVAILADGAARRRFSRPADGVRQDPRAAPRDLRGGDGGRGAGDARRGGAGAGRLDGADRQLRDRLAAWRGGQVRAAGADRRALPAGGGDGAAGGAGADPGGRALGRGRDHRREGHLPGGGAGGDLRAPARLPGGAGGGAEPRGVGRDGGRGRAGARHAGARAELCLERAVPGARGRGELRGRLQGGDALDGAGEPDGATRRRAR